MKRIEHSASGDVLLAAVEGQRLVLEKREAVLERVKRRFAHIPPGVSLAEELIAERRAEAGCEERSKAGGTGPLLPEEPGHARLPEKE